MEFVMILVVLLLVTLFIWRSASVNKKASDEQGRSNPNPHAPASDRRM